MTTGNGEGGVRRIVSRGLMIVALVLAGGLVAAAAGVAGVARIALIAGLLTLVALPVVNVAAEVIEEWRRRERIFFWTAVGVLALLTYNVWHLLI